MSSEYDNSHDFISKMSEDLNNFQNEVELKCNTLSPDEFWTWFDENNHVMKKYAKIIQYLEFDSIEEINKVKEKAYDSYMSIMKMFWKKNLGYDIF